MTLMALFIMFAWFYVLKHVLKLKKRSHLENFFTMPRPMWCIFDIYIYCW